MTVPNGSMWFSGLKVTRPRPQGRVVAKAAGDKAVRRLVKGHGEDDRQDPGAGLVEHRRGDARRRSSPPRLASSASKRAPPRARSKSPAPAAHRLAAREPRRRRRRERRGRGGDLLHLAGSPLQCSARSQPASSARRGRSPSAPPSARHRQIVGDQHAVKADLAANDLADHPPRQGRRRRRVDRAIDDMRGHRPRHRGQRAERREIGARQRRHARSSTTGQA